jgi:hypothetical protein
VAVAAVAFKRSTIERKPLRTIVTLTVAHPRTIFFGVAAARRDKHINEINEQRIGLAKKIFQG